VRVGIGFSLFGRGPVGLLLPGGGRGARWIPLVVSARQDWIMRTFEYSDISMFLIGCTVIGAGGGFGVWDWEWDCARWGVVGRDA